MWCDASPRRLWIWPMCTGLRFPRRSTTHWVFSTPGGTVSDGKLTVKVCGGSLAQPNSVSAATTRTCRMGNLPRRDLYHVRKRRDMEQWFDKYAPTRVKTGL